MPLAIGAIVGGLVGSAIGSAFGAAALGWAIGSLIGQFLFAPSNDQVFSGPRLENTSAAVSNIIGSPIQIVYGTTRVPGSIIWSNNITERKIVDKESSGSGSSKSTSTTITYEYYLDFAVAICEGTIKAIKKIWANNKLIYDTTGAVVQEPWLDFELFTGETDQRHSSYMKDILVANGDVSSSDQIPAHRGLAYIVFKQFKLEAYGNRAPYNIDFEVVGTGTISYPEKALYTGGRAVGSGDVYSGGEVAWQWGGIQQVDNDLSYIYTATPRLRAGWSVRYTYGAPEAGWEVLETPPEVLAYAWLVLNGDLTIARDSLTASHTFVAFNREGDIVTHFFRLMQSDGNGDSYIAIFDPELNVKSIRYAGQHDYGSFVYYNHRGFFLDKYWVAIETEANWRRYKWMDCSTSYIPTGVTPKYDYYVEVLTNANPPTTDFPNNSDVIGAVAPYYIFANSSTYPNHLGGSVINKYNNKKEVATWVAWNSTDANTRVTDALVYQFTDESFALRNTQYARMKLYVEPWFYLRTSDYPSYSSLGCSDETNYSYLDNIYPPNTIINHDGGHWIIFGLRGVSSDSILPNQYGLCAAWLPTAASVPTKWIQTTFGTGSSTVGAYTQSGQPDNEGYYDSKADKWFIRSLSNTSIIWFDFGEETWYQRYTSKLGTANYSGAPYHIGNYRFIVPEFDSSEPQLQDWFKHDKLIDLQAPASTSVTLAQVITDMSSRAGLDTDTYLDVTGITSINVDGFSIRDRETARKSMEDVALPYFVDPVVSDWKLKYVKRGEVTGGYIIPYNDLGCTESDYIEPYSLALPEENNLPKEIDFRYLGALNNYQVSHQRDARHSKATNSDDKQTISTFVVMSDNKAKEAATRFLRNAWVNSKRLSFTIPKKYSYLEPTDIIQIVTTKDLLITARIVEVFNTYNTLEVSAELEAYEAYEDRDYSEFTAGFDSSDLQKIPIIAMSSAFIIESYPMNDLFDEGYDYQTEGYIYLGAKSYYSNWPGATIYFGDSPNTLVESSDLTVPCYEGTITAQTGTLYNILDTYQAYSYVDKLNTITVEFRTDPLLTSLTEEEALQGGQNVLWIDNSSFGELIVAQTVVDNTGGSYTFSNLYRGRYGSHTRIPNNSTSSVGERVILITPTTIARGSVPYGTFDVTYYYKISTQGLNPESVKTENHYYRALYNDSKPSRVYKPISDSSGITFTWVPIISHTVPTLKTPASSLETDPATALGVVDDRYKVRMEQLDGTLLREVENVSARTYTYTNADMTTDGVSSDSAMLVRVYPISKIRTYDTVYHDKIIYLPNSLYKAINAATTSDCQMCFEFNDTTGGTFTSQIGSDTLTTETGSALSIRKGGITTYTRKSGSYFFTKGNRFSTTSTTSGADSKNFSFFVVFKVNQSDTSNTTSTMHFLTRDGGGIYGQHAYAIQTNSSRAVTFDADTNTSVALGTTGETLAVLLTVDNEESVNWQRETIYVNGVQVSQETATSFVSAWSGEFLFGDTQLNANWQSYSELQISAFAYWNYKLSATEAAAVDKVYRYNGGFKI